MWSDRRNLLSIIRTNDLAVLRKQGLLIQNWRLLKGLASIQIESIQFFQFLEWVNSHDTKFWNSLLEFYWKSQTRPHCQLHNKRYVVNKFYSFITYNIMRYIICELYKHYRSQDWTLRDSKLLIELGGVRILNFNTYFQIWIKPISHLKKINRMSNKSPDKCDNFKISSNYQTILSRLLSVNILILNR